MSYKILETAITKVVGSLLSDALLGRNGKSIEDLNASLYLNDDEKVADVMTMVGRLIENPPKLSKKE